MYKIVICIPTYKRPLMLERLILSLIGCKFNKSLIKVDHIIIVDNDIDKTAEFVIHELKEKLIGLLEIVYFNHPFKGISNARNELLRKAFLFEPDYIVFIDDDEHVTSDWLNELVKTIVNNDADAVRGPVLVEFDKIIPEYLSCCFKRESYPNNSQIFTVTTGNLILKRKSLQKYDIWFDPRFNIIGSGDSYFGIQLLKKGATIFWSANAIVYETIPESRANLRWLIKRVYRGASTYTYVLKLERKYLKIIKKILVSLAYIISGGIAIIILPVKIKKRYWGILTFSEGIGGLAGLINIFYYEYK
jgi:succinoglycan biosynthesis protein ExoM